MAGGDAEKPDGGVIPCSVKEPAGARIDALGHICGGIQGHLAAGVVKFTVSDLHLHNADVSACGAQSCAHCLTEGEQDAPGGIGIRDVEGDGHGVAVALVRRLGVRQRRTLDPVGIIPDRIAVRF